MDCSINNVTYRKKKQKPCDDFSINYGVENETAQVESLCRKESLPDLNLEIDTEQYKQQSAEIEKLKNQLKKSDHFTNTLLLEISDLKKANTSKDIVINSLKRLCSGSQSPGRSPTVCKNALQITGMTSTPLSTSNQRKPAPLFTAIGKIEQSTQTITQDIKIGEGFKTRTAKLYTKRIKKLRQKIKKMVNRVLTLKTENEKLILDIQNIVRNDKNKEANKDSRTFDEDSDKELVDDTTKEMINKYLQNDTNAENTITTKSIKETNNTNQTTKKRIYILADQQGRGIRQKLQKLVGPEFQVFCIWKAKAKMENILKSCENDIATLNMNDFVIVLSGSNDNNPYEFLKSLLIWLDRTTNTNVIVSEIPKNKYLNESKLNYEVKMLCQRFDNCMYLNMNYSMQIPLQNFFSTFVSRCILKEVLHICYKNNYNNYQTKNVEDHEIKIKGNCMHETKSTQTDKHLRFFVSLTETSDNVDNKKYLNKSIQTEIISNEYVTLSTESVDASLATATVETEVGRSNNHLFRL